MKHLRTLTILIAMLWGYTMVHAEAVQIDGIWYNLVKKIKQAEVTYPGNGTTYQQTDIIIPTTVTYDGVEYTVTTIGRLYGSNLNSVTIPESVTTIGNYAFFQNFHLKYITIPEHSKLTSIGIQAFEGCQNLTSIFIPEGVTSIERETFSGCLSLSSITFSEDSRLTKIGDFAFINCQKLTSIIIPENVTIIREGSFRGCLSLKVVTFEDGNENLYLSYNRDLIEGMEPAITEETLGLFGDCPLEAVYLGRNLDFEEAPFSNKFTLESVTMGSGVSLIKDWTFKNCDNITSVHVSSIEDWCRINFGYCANPLTYANNLYLNGELVTELVIPEGVTSIGDNAFDGCYNLISITIPESVTSIGSGAFSGCSNLNSVNINSIEAWCKITFESFDSNPIAYSNNLYINEERVTELVIPSTVTEIKDYAFYGYKDFVSVTIPESVISIGSYSFWSCTGLTSIIIPDGVTSIGNETFYGCSNLAAISLPEGVTSIGSYTFYGCSKLATITIPEGVTSIGSNAFYGCNSLATIILPASIEKVEWKAFAECPELLDVYCLANNVPSATTNAFDNSYPDYATLHVPTSAIASYQATAPWSSFGTVVAYQPVTNITLSQSSATIFKGDQLTLIATVLPENAANRTVTWSSSNESIASVDANGVVTAVALGTATITATANDISGTSASCEVTVEKITSVLLTINQYGSGTFCSEYALDFSEVEGLRAYAATGYNNITGVVTLTRVKTTKAGEGLFVKGEPGVEYRVPILESSADNTLNLLVGTLEDITLNATSDNGLYANYKYTIKEGDADPLFYQFSDGSTQVAGKAYLQIPVAWLPATESKAISLRFDDGETTDIEEIELTDNGRQATAVFDLTGRRVENPAKGTIYIVNGKKIVY